MLPYKKNTAPMPIKPKLINVITSADTFNRLRKYAKGGDIKFRNLSFKPKV